MLSLRAVNKIGTQVAGLLMVTVLLVACSGQAETEGGLPLAAQGEDTPQREIDPGGGESSSGGRGVISSEGTVIPSTPSGDSGPGLEESGGGPERPSATEGPLKWLIYTDTAYDFFIKYPDIYVILPESAPLPATDPPRVHRVRFQDKARASGQFADREPAQFAIEVFELDPPVPLRDWLDSTGLVPARATVEQVHLDGAGDGWRVRRPVLMAPNEFYYFATKEYVYRLTPLGPHSQDMLASFQLSPGR